MNKELRLQLIASRVGLRKVPCQCGHRRHEHHCLGRCKSFVTCHCNKFVPVEPKLTEKLAVAVRKILAPAR